MLKSVHTIGVLSLFRRYVTMAADNLKIAVCQLTASSDKQANFRKCQALIAEGVQHGAKMVFLPEGFDCIADSKDQARQLAELLDGSLIRSYRELAKELNVWLSLGGFKEQSVDSSMIYNTHVIVNPEGTLVGVYRKVHLFHVDIPGQISLTERDFTKPGIEICAPIDSQVGRIGMGICYDVRFPEFSLALRQQGAQVLTYPSVFTVPTGKAHWELLLRCRAVENQCYVVAAAQTGWHNKNRESYGHSMVVDPWGEIICEITEGTGIAMAEINLEKLEKIRTNLPVQTHRRADIYGCIVTKKAMCSTSKLTERVNSYNFGGYNLSPSVVFQETDLSFAFVNRKPVLPGHMLVCPLRQIKRFSELSPYELVDLFMLVKEVADAVEKEFGSTSLTISIQDGPDAGQSVQHVHVHILPRKQGDFKKNDDVYNKLHNHDKEENGKPLLEDSKLWRKEEEMFHEASRMRKYFIK